MIEAIRQAVNESIELKKSFFLQNESLIARVAEQICSALQNGNKILFYGNGGSAADAQHLAAELVGRFGRERHPLPAIALTTDTSILTAIGNDYGFERIFARQMRALGKSGDIAVAISTSGNSPNVIAATEVAGEMGLITVGLTGGDGGRLADKVRYHLNVPHNSTARVQEVHIMIGHILCQLVEENMKGL